MASNSIYRGPGESPKTYPEIIEGICTESCLPGNVMDYAAAGAGFELMDDAATVFGKPLLVAARNELKQQKVTTAWTVNESMQVYRPAPGQIFSVFVVTAQSLVKGTPLTRSAVTPGALVIAATDGTQEIVAYADETVTTTATQRVDVRAA